MSTNFGFGNLTVNGKKIDWETAKTYDADSDGKLSTSEYNALLKEVDADGFNGVPAFGTVDADGNGQITEAELAVTDQKVQIGDYLDAYFESMADASTTSGASTTGVSANFKTAATAFMNNFITTFLANKENADNTENMSSEFVTEFTTFVDSYNALQEQITEAKGGDTTSAALYSAVDDANSNGNISNKETAAIKTAGKDYAVEKALAGDYSFLTSLGIKSTQLVTLKGLVKGMSTSATPATVLDSIKSEIAKLIAAADVAKIVTASTALEAADTAKKNVRSTESYSVDALELDYSSIDGYEEDETKTVKKKGKDGANDLAKADIEKLRAQMKAQIEAKCKAEGTTFSEELFTSVFDASETKAIEEGVSGKDGGTFHHSKSSYNVQDLIATFVSTFNTTMSDTIAQMAEDKTTSDGLPTETAITTDLLDDDASTLTSEEQALKELQEDLLDGDQKLVESTNIWTTLSAKAQAKEKAEEVIDTLTSGLLTRMKTSLGSKYSENKANNIILAAKEETLAGVGKNTTLAEVVSNFMSAFQIKYTELSTTTEA